jgi:hypothetical protein
MGGVWQILVGVLILLTLAACASSHIQAASNARLNAAPAPIGGQRPTEAEFDAVRRQIIPCWYVDPNRVVKLPMVGIAVDLLRDGTVQTTRIIDSDRAVNDAYFRNAAHAAYRAVWKSSPLHLPAAKYAAWKHIRFHFDAAGVRQ